MIADAMTAAASEPEIEVASFFGSQISRYHALAPHVQKMADAMITASMSSLRSAAEMRGIAKGQPRIELILGICEQHNMYLCNKPGRGNIHIDS